MEKEIKLDFSKMIQNWKWVKQLWETSFWKKIYNFLKEQKLKDKKILDVWSGNGRDSLFFLKKWFKVSVNDISEIWIKNLSDNIDELWLKLENKILWDIRNIEILNKYDVIFASNSLHYFNDLDTKKVFKKLYNILDNGWFLCIRVKALTDWKKEYFFDKNKSFKHLFTIEYMKNIFKDLENIKIIKLEKVKNIHTDLKKWDYLVDFIDLIIQKNNLIIL